ncbi:NADH-quinone oxidoreductase subunit A [Marinobacterium jannaschii]|uniref:NADH-quinone oxidoreductase subunit A n=1 Tax=Marinobacterium jannaschii TaxID=64970 RepID=UPI000A07A8CD|nr:NADH-quinone oxidoreductase subunit A [Marinobacterium jannaschii]
MTVSEHIRELWPLFLYGLMAVTLVALILAVSSVLGQRHRARAADEPFESGIVHVGDTHIRFSAPYFVIAVLFVIFDLEAAFIYAWAISFPQSGWAGLIEIGIFIGILLIALFYLWLLGALEWGNRADNTTLRPQPIQGDSQILSGKLPAPAPAEPEVRL